MRLAEEAKLRNQMSAKRAKAEAERKHQVGSQQRASMGCMHWSNLITVNLQQLLVEDRRLIVETVYMTFNNGTG